VQQGMINLKSFGVEVGENSEPHFFSPAFSHFAQDEKRHGDDKSDERQQDEQKDDNGYKIQAGLIVFKNTFPDKCLQNVF
jgi:hypothetical protein